MNRVDRSDVFYHMLKRNPGLSGRIMEASPFLNLPAYLKRTGAAYDDVMKQYGFDPRLAALGQAQNRFRAWLEAVVNGYDHGLDGATGAHPGRFTAAELDCATLEFYLDKLPPSGLLDDVSAMRGGAEVGQVAAAAARFYSELPSLVAGRGRPERPDAPPPLAPCSAGPGRHADALFAHLEKEAPGAFDFLVLHGSLSTQDYVEGCSDLDAFAVVNAEVASSAEKILGLRGAVLGAWGHFFSVDPFQHHGIMLATAQDARFYAQHFFPLELLRFSRTATGACPEFRVRDSRFDELVIIHQILHGMLDAGAFEGSVHSAKRRIQTALLLPALLLMSEGKYAYKRDSFGAVSKLLGEPLPALDACSSIRARNAYGAAPPPGPGGLDEYRRRVLDAPPQPGLAAELVPLAGELRELAARFAARVVSRDPAMPHVQSAFEWADEPSPRRPADYEAALRSVSAKIEKHGNVSVLSQGSVSAPGISDLDLVISVRGRTGLPGLDDEAWNAMLDGPERYLCAHRPFMVPERMLERIGEIWPVSGLTGPGAPAGEPDWGAHLFTTVETYALLGALGAYPASFGTGRMEARSMLSQLYSLTYTLQILRAAGEDAGADGFEDAVRCLRRDWFGLDGGARRSRLLCLWADSLAVHLRAVDRVRARIAAEARYGGRASGSVFDQAAFVPGWTPRLSLECASAAGARRASVLPAEFLLVLCLYCRAGGPFAEYLSAHMSHRVDLEGISCPRAAELFYPRARLLGEAVGELRAAAGHAVLPTFSDGGERPAYGGFWHCVLSAASGSMPDALLSGGMYERMHEACAALSAERGARASELRALGEENAGLRKRAGELGRKAAASEARASELRSAYEAQSAMLRDIHQSLAFRLLRKYDSTLGRMLPLARLARRASRPAPPARPEAPADPEPTGKRDVVCMPVTDWGFRIQRTNHLMRRFARDGHRVFVLPHRPAPVEGLCRVGHLEEGIYSLDLDCRDFDIYGDALSGADLDRLERAFSAAAARLDLDPVLFVSFPSWGPLAMRLKKRTGCPVVFDVLDDFGQFSNVSPARAGEERELARSADLVLATSKVLYDRCAGGNAMMLPNAGEPGHFGAAPAESPLSGYARPVVGYFGAISDWFDADLVRYLAARRPEYSFVLIGHTFGADTSALDLPNIHLLGERPYADLPAYLHGFDACIIPFKDTDLVRATHPVKIYEYAAAGKPVVARDMAELRPMAEACSIASSDEEFARLLDAAVAERDPAAARRRAEFARRNTWDERFERLRERLGGSLRRGGAGPGPLVSFVVVSWNSSEYIEACLRSIAGQSYPDTETVLVDNASSDGTAELVRARFPGVRLVCNARNEGFAEANNIGIRLARGRYVALLNPDAVAGPRWAETLVAELERDASLAAASGRIYYLGEGAPDRSSVFCTWPKVAPFSSKPHNFHGDEPRSLVDYLSGAAMMVRREAIERVGPMDPGYFLYFDETDWCARMIRAGYGLLYSPGAEAWHKVSPSVGADQKAYYMERSRLRFALKNFDASYVVPLLATYAAESAGILLRDALRGDFGASRVRRQAAGWNMASLRATLRARAEDRRRMGGRTRSYNRSLPLRGVSP